MGNSQALGVLEAAAAKTEARNLSIFGYDGDPEFLTALEEGEFTAGEGAAKKSLQVRGATVKVDYNGYKEAAELFYSERLEGKPNTLEMLPEDKLPTVLGRVSGSVVSSRTLSPRGSMASRGADG